MFPMPILHAATAVRAPRQPAAARTERFEISIPKHEIAMRPAGIRSSGWPPNPASERRWTSFSRLRRFPSAGGRRCWTSRLLLFSYGGMLALFWALGGRIGFNKLDAMVTGATLALFYAQYFALFTVFGGSRRG